MKTLNVIGSIVIMTMLVLAGIYLLVAASSLVQSASATDIMNTITDGAVGSSNNNSNDSLGNLVYVAHGIEETVNPVNDTYIVISYVDSVTLMPPNSTTGNVINATERGNFTSNILSSGLSIDQGQGLIMTESGGGQQETATVTFASLSHSDPEGATGSGTGAAFFSTNSTGRLAFLNNMVGIAQVEFSPEGSTVRIWEWKGGSLALENGNGGTATENQSISTS